MKSLIIAAFLLAIDLCAQPLEIWIDADFTNHFESSHAIEIGATEALRNYNFRIGGREIKLVRKDHRGSSKRSKRNIQNFIKNKNGIAMMSGIHSPPLLEHKDYINKSEVPFLVPWAAAAPITRSGELENFIFRLSIDDSKAGFFMSQYAAENLSVTKPCLLLENTGWGKSNFKTMTEGFSKFKIPILETIWFPWGIAEFAAKDIASQLYKKKCDHIFFVGNSKEGKTLITAIANYPSSKTIPIMSHWGITGGDFHKQVSHDLRSKVSLKFIQTNFNFNQSKKPHHQKVIDSIIKHNKEIRSPRDILAGTGTSHAFDLTSIFILALQDINLDEKIGSIRIKLKNRLENQRISFLGLLRRYTKPFGPYSKAEKDAHEALGFEDFAIGKYLESGSIVNIDR